MLRGGECQMGWGWNSCNCCAFNGLWVLQIPRGEEFLSPDGRGGIGWSRRGCRFGKR